jgi:hypothetical protein
MEKKVEMMLFWSAVMGFTVMFIWFGMIFFAGEAIYEFHEKVCPMEMISLQTFMTANLIGIGMWKMAVILCFAIPWLAMKIVGK